MEFFDESQDPFSQADVNVNQGYQPPVFENVFEGQGNSYSDSNQLSASLPDLSSSVVDQEELERQALRDSENRERQRKLQAKDEKENRQKELKRQQARAELSSWYENRNKLILQAKEMNTTKEKELLQSKAQFTDSSSWKKVASMIDFKDSTDRKDQARMKSVLLAKKHESK